MSGSGKLSIAKITFLLSVAPALLHAYKDGPDPRKTGAPGDNQTACVEAGCHTGPVNSPQFGGSVQIILPSGNSYMPTVKQHIMVRVNDPAQKRWGFQLTARLASDPANGQAGDLNSTDNNTQVICNDGRAKPCRAGQDVQFIEHTLGGTRLGTTQGATFEFDWTPPSSNAGDVVFYVAANAANGNEMETGDHIYTSRVRLLAPCETGASAPTIDGASGVVNGASFNPGIAPNTYITIKGNNLASTTRTWAEDELPGGKLPTQLSCTTVMVNNKPAYVEFVSPTQVNAIAPDDGATGAVQVTVTLAGQTSSPAPATMQTFSPAFFLFPDGRHLAATHLNGGFIGAPGLIRGVTTTPARAGELIILYGTGFGPTNPPIAAGQATDKLAPIATPLTIRIGNAPASVTVTGGFAGLVPPFAAVYQFNVQVPAGISGEARVVAEIGGQSSHDGASCCFITVQ